MIEGVGPSPSGLFARRATVTPNHREIDTDFTRPHRPFYCSLLGVPPRAIYRILVSGVTTFEHCGYTESNRDLALNTPVLSVYTNIHLSTFISSQTGRSVGI